MDNPKQTTADTIIAILLFPLAFWLRGIVTVDLWDWFLVPLGVIAIGFWHAVGMSAIIAFFTIQPSMHKEFTATALMIYSIAMSLVFWGLGAIYHSFM